jgi:hypothetical protein
MDKKTQILEVIDEVIDLTQIFKLSKVSEMVERQKLIKSELIKRNLIGYNQTWAFQLNTDKRINKILIMEDKESDKDLMDDLKKRNISLNGGVVRRMSTDDFNETIDFDPDEWKNYKRVKLIDKIGI